MSEPTAASSRSPAAPPRSRRRSSPAASACSLTRQSTKSVLLISNTMSGRMSEWEVRAQSVPDSGDACSRVASLPAAGVWPVPTALKFPGLCGLVSGFGGLVTVWLHVDRGSVTGSGDPRNRTKLLVGTGLSTPCPFTWSFVACQVCHGHRACVHCGRAAGR